MIRGVHHVNFLVRDLDEAAARFARLPGLRAGPREDLPGRGVRTARFRAGDTWIVLVQPVADGEPMRQLERRGEGFFLLSLAVDDVRAAAATVRAAGVRTGDVEPRTGLDGWQVIDVEPAELNGVLVQLCQDDDEDRP